MRDLPQRRRVAEGMRKAEFLPANGSEFTRMLRGLTSVSAQISGADAPSLAACRT